MNNDKHIRALLGARRGPRQGHWDQWAAIWDWEALGFPGVYTALFFLTIDGARRYAEQRTLPFPDACCRCGKPATAYVDFRPFIALPFLRIPSSRVHVRSIPHCNEHASAGPLAFASVTEDPGSCTSAMVFSTHRPFIEQCVASNLQDGEQSPPWVAFPRSPPFGGFSQGTNEAWMRFSLAPFWRSLSPEARREYFARHRAPSAWQEWLTHQERANDG